MRIACFFIVLAVAMGNSDAGPASDRDLATYVDTLTAIDSHAYPMAWVPAGAPADTDFDALPLDAIPSFDLPLALRASNPAYREAQRFFYGIATSETDSAQTKAFVRAREKLLREHGDHFPAWVLDRLHIGVMLGNRIAMGRGLESPRFRWVAFADPLMLPLDVSGEAELTPDTRSLYPQESKLLGRYLRDIGLTKIPATFASFQRDVVSATLERQRAAGAVSIKFEAAYLRPLNLDPADSAAAAAIYQRYASSGVPTHAEYKLLEDYLVRFISREAGRLGMAVQIHSLDVFGGFYSASGAAPRNLESMMIHDGGITPERARQLARMVMRENAMKAYGVPMPLLDKSRLSAVEFRAFKPIKESRLPTRRQFLFFSLSGVVAATLAPRSLFARSTQRGGKHPEPRPGIDASKVVPDANLKNARAAPAFADARAIPEILDGIRCHCGCADPGDKYSLLSCYEGDGMAQDCEICQGQARLARRMLRMRRSLDQIRSAIDSRYDS